MQRQWRCGPAGGAAPPAVRVGTSRLRQVAPPRCDRYISGVAAAVRQSVLSFCRVETYRAALADEVLCQLQTPESYCLYSSLLFTVCVLGLLLYVTCASYHSTELPNTLCLTLGRCVSCLIS